MSETLISDLLLVIKKHAEKLDRSDINKIIKEIEELNRESEPDEYYVFFDDLTEDAQLEYLDKTGIEYDDLDTSKPLGVLNKK